MKWIFDETHPDYPKAESTMKELTEARALWQTRWKELQQVTSVAQVHQASLKSLAADIAKSRSEAALIVSCAVLSSLVLKQSQHRNQGQLPSMLKAGLKQAAAMGLSLGDFPSKLRNLIDGLNKESTKSTPSSPVPTPNQTEVTAAEPATSSSSAQEPNEKKQKKEKKEKAEKTEKSEKQTGKREASEDEVAPCFCFTSLC